MGHRSLSPPQSQCAQVELYDHQLDPQETENVAAEHPELVTRLLAQLRTGETKLQAGSRGVRLHALFGDWSERMQVPDPRDRRPKRTGGGTETRRTSAAYLKLSHLASE